MEKAELLNRNEVLLTKREVKELLRVTYPTLNSWDKTGVLRPLKLGVKMVRYLKADIDLLLIPKN